MEILKTSRVSGLLVQTPVTPRPTARRPVDCSPTSVDVVADLVGKVIDAPCHRDECLCESRCRNTRLDRAVPVDEVWVETEPVAGGVVLWSQIGPEDGFNFGVIEEVSVLSLDDRLSRRALGLTSEV